jgi:type I restriction-modification system DNA methylase subunit
MSKARKLKETPADSNLPTQLGLLPNPDAIHVYWDSSLFNEVYLKNDLPARFPAFFHADEEAPFHNFYQGFIDLCVDKESEDFRTWSETETITNWIKPMMALLGWQINPTQTPFMEEVSFSVEERGTRKTYRPDLLYVDDPRVKKYVSGEKDTNKRLVEARNAVTAIVEAKYWDRLEEYRQGVGETRRRVDKKESDSATALSPDEQILKYMEILDKDYGILTDGKTWKLYHKSASSDSAKRCFEFDIGDLKEFVLGGINESDRRRISIEAIKYFYFFFSKASLSPGQSQEPVVNEVLRYSQQYVDKAEEDLKNRFLQAMNFACNGFKRAMKSESDSLDLKLIRNVSESHLFNILFVRNCEVRNVLPLKDVSYRKASLTAVIEKLDRLGFDPNKDDDLNALSLTRAFSQDFRYSHEGHEIYDRLIALYRLVHSGSGDRNAEGFKVVGFKESIFSKQEWSAAKKFRLNNLEMVHILFQLGFADSSIQGRKYQQIPYNAFTPRQLGSIYESFLEFRLEEAPCDMVFRKKEWSAASLKSKEIAALDIPKVSKGELFFTPNNQDRRATGSYYTPDHVVQYVVAEVLTPAVEGKSAQDILKIRTCDPAMGSGHFLNAALNFLTRAYLAAIARESGDSVDITFQNAKRLILEHCIFGVDFNERAVKLAKLSLWLESAAPGKQLEHLDNQLKLGNSLIPRDRISRSEIERWNKAFDWKQFKPESLIFVGNPPWGATLSGETKTKISELYNIPQDNLNSFEAFLLLGDLVGVQESMFVIPRNFLRTDGYVDCRKRLFESQRVLSVADFGACFVGVTTEAITIHYSSEKRAPGGIKLVPLAKSNDFSVRGKLDQKEVLKDPKARLNLWWAEELGAVTSKIEDKGVALRKYVEHYRGIEYGKNGEVTECTGCGNFTSLPKKKNDKKKCPECNATITLKDAKPYYFISREKTKKHRVPILVGKVINRYQLREEYFMEPGLKGIQYKEHAFRDEDKILIMKISESIKAYLDTQRRSATQAIYMLYLRKEHKKTLSLPALMAILNSKVFRFYFEYKINMGASLTTNVVLEDMLDLPVPPAERLAQLTKNDIDRQVRDLQLCYQNDSKKVASLEAAIEKSVAAIYGITARELAQIEEFLKEIQASNGGVETDEADEVA